MISFYRRCSLISNFTVSKRNYSLKLAKLRKVTNLFLNTCFSNILPNALLGTWKINHGFQKQPEAHDRYTYFANFVYHGFNYKNFALLRILNEWV